MRLVMIVAGSSWWPFQRRRLTHLWGGVSHLLDVCLSVFFDSDRHDLRHGCLFPLLGFGAFMLCAVVEMLLADINAICESIGAMGPSGVVPCFFCRNVISFAAKARPYLRDNDNFVDLSCRARARWNMHTNASLHKLLTDLRDAAMSVAANTMKKEQLAAKQTLNGYKHIEGNFLLNQNLIGKPLQSICIDWMHLLFQTGDWGRAVVQILILGTTARTFNAYDQLADYTRRFRFPRGMFAPTLFNATHWDSCKDAKTNQMLCF
jgi:hypothetical protein